MDKVRICVESYAEGEYSLHGGSFIHKAYHECIELHLMDYYKWTDKTYRYVQSCPRLEITAWMGSTCVGWCVLVDETNDFHVGECATVLTQYVPQEYRNIGVASQLLRECVRIARATGHDTLVYSKREAPGRYTTIYKRIKHG
jgi:GNAT superfamily N-acetyltransferase